MKYAGRPKVRISLVLSPDHRINQSIHSTTRKRALDDLHRSTFRCVQLALRAASCSTPTTSITPRHAAMESSGETMNVPEKRSIQIR